jgi:hypothetical protein
MASAVVLFVVLVGVVTFDSWPHPGRLFTGSGGNVSLNTLTTQAPPQPAPTPNLVALLGGPAPAATTRASNRGGSNGGTGTLPIGPGTIDGHGSPPVPGGGGGGGGQNSPVVQNPPPSPPPVTSRSTNIVQQVVAGAGNNVESDTNTLGDQLGGSDSTLGGLVQGLGSTVNNTLQGLAGTR